MLWSLILKPIQSFEGVCFVGIVHIEAIVWSFCKLEACQCWSELRLLCGEGCSNHGACSRVLELLQRPSAYTADRQVIFFLKDVSGETPILLPMRSTV